MDQLRTVLRWLKEQHFWVLCVLVALIAIGCWWKAAGTLRAEFQANQSAIVSQFTSMAGLKGKPFHPNDSINQKQIEQTKQQAEHVKDTWQQLYDRQRETVLKWPERALSKEFIKAVENKQFGDEIPPDLRSEYMNYVERHFPRLPEKVGARLQQPGEGGAGYGRGYDNPAFSRGYGEGATGDALLQIEDDYICEWLDQGRIRAELDFPQRPSHLRIWVTQENLWVYHTLLQAIANTNEAAGATRVSNAAVRVIYSLTVGRDAAALSRGKGRVLTLAAPATDPTMLGAEGEMMTGMEGGERGGYGGYDAYSRGGREGGAFGGEYSTGRGGYGSSLTDEQSDATLLAGRYLDKDGKPMGGGGMDSSMMDPNMGGEPAAAAAPDLSQFSSAEYKRLPVRMELQMDQRWITHLIAECARQPLQVEVEEVQIKASSGDGSSGFGGGYGGGPLGGGGGYGGRGYESGGNMGANLFGERTGLQTFPAQPHIVDVAIQGVVYIFNPPNPDVLQTPDEDPQVAMAQ